MIGDHKATAASNEDKSSNAPTKKTPRGARTTRKFGTQSTTLEILDDSMGPLGPLGSTESPPVPPQKEDVLSSPIATNKNEILGRSSTKSSLRGLLDSVNLNDDDDDDNDKSIIKPREPPPVKPANFDINMKRNIPPGISIEQAARPSFEVSIGDPHKVGDLTSSHTVYQVRTKVYRPKMSRIMVLTKYSRHRQKHIDRQNSKQQGGIGIFCGYIINYIQTILELLYHHLLKNKQWVDLTKTLSNREERH